MRHWLKVLLIVLSSLFLISCTGDSKITITFNSNGGSEIEAIEVTTDQTSLNLPEPEREGFSFDGWYLDEALTEPFTIGALLSNTELTLYAKWIEDVVLYTITFNTNGGSSVTSIQSASGVLVNAPTAPTRSGYTFEGWFSDVGLTAAYTFTTMPAQNITLYAKWAEVIVERTMSFESNGGSSVAGVTLPVGQTVSAPTEPTRLGYTFNGWYSDVGLTTVYTFSTMPAQNITLYAKWTIHSYTITFESNGGSAVTAITQNYQSAVTAPTNPTRTGYTFDGWYSDVGLTAAYTFTTMPAQNITLYAKWAVNSYTITFETSGGSAVTAITQNYQSTVAAPTNPTRTGYTFDGWYSDVGLATLYAFTTMPAENITLYAKWTINSYTITFETSGGSAVTAITQNYQSAVTAPTDPTRDGYVFDGWYSNVGLTTSYTFTTMPAENITLYAKWILPSFEITYVDGTQTYPKTVIQQGNPIVLMDTPTKVGHTFVGWYLDPLHTTPFELTIMPNMDLTLYAKWTLTTYTIHYDTQGGSTIEDAHILYQMTIPNPGIPVKEGYQFTGWYFDIDKTLPLNITQMPAEDFTLYAGWMEDSGYQSIQTILLTQIEQVKVRGVVYYKYPNPMNPGFYLYDGTGYIFVLHDASTLNIGDAIEFEAEFGFFEYVPQLSQVMHLMTQTDFQTMPTYEEMTISEISGSQPDQFMLYSKPVILRGTIEIYGMDYLLTELSGAMPLMINFKSYQGIMPHPLMGFMGEKIEIHAVILGYNPMQNIWHINYDPTEAIEIVVMTDEEKVDELLYYGSLMLDQKEFFSGEQLDLPSTHEGYQAEIQFETFGEHSDLFDVETGVFAEVLEETHVQLRITVTIGTVEKTIDVTLIVKPILTVTIQEFLLLDEGSTATVEGVVVMGIGDMMGIVLIADHTGSLIVVIQKAFNTGDKVRFTGKHGMMQGLHVMANDDKDVIDELLGVGYHIPLNPYPLSIEAFNDLDVMNPSYWLSYVLVEGTLTMDHMSHTFILTEGDASMRIMVISMDVYEMLSSFEHLNVALKGFTIPNFDDEPYLMFLFVGHGDDIEIPGTDEEILEYMGSMLKAYVEGTNYIPGQMLELPTDHPVLGITVSYQSTSPWMDISHMMISHAIDEETTIVIQATLTLNEATLVVDLELVVVPITYTTIAEVLASDGLTHFYVDGIVIFKIFEFGMGFYMIADADDIIFFMTVQPLTLGDRVILYGRLMDNDGMPMIVSNQMGGDAFVQKISSNQAMPLIPTVVSIEDYMDLTEAANFKYFQLQGVLSKVTNEVFTLSDSLDNTIPIFVPSEDAMDMLNVYVGYEVIISGIAMSQSEHDTLILIFLGFEGTLELTTDPLDVIDQIKSSILDHYTTQTFRQGAYHQLLDMFPPFVQVTYEVTTGTTLYNQDTHMISLAIEAETYIEITATITVGDISDTLVFEMHVNPIMTSTIDAFLNGDVDTLYLIRGYVVLSQFGYEGGVAILIDQTGRLLIVEDLELEVGTEVILSGYKGTFMGLTTFDPEEPKLLFEVISHVIPTLDIYQEMTVDDLNLLDLEDRSTWGMPVEVNGYVGFNTEYQLVITSIYGGSSGITLHTANYDFIYETYNYEGFRVVFKGFMLPYYDEDLEAFVPIIFVGYDESLMLYSEDPADIALDIFNVIEMRLEGKTYTSRSLIDFTFYLSSVEAEIEFEHISGPSGIININTGFIEDVVGITEITLKATVTIDGYVAHQMFVVVVHPFVPLNLPYLKADMEADTFPGLIVYKMGYQSDFMGGTRFVVELRFPTADQLGYDYFVLEYYDQMTETWSTYMHNDEPLTTLYYSTYYEDWINSDNFSLYLPPMTTYRLKSVGGGMTRTSNEVYVASTMVETNFIGWSLDESMYITGVMAPLVGYGLTASATVQDLTSYDIVEEGILYQWYRVHPYTYEMIMIDGATDSTYITTLEDIGYHIMVRMYGDEINVGGYVQVMSGYQVKVFNPTRVLSYHSMGFTLEFSHYFNPQELENLVVFDDYYFERNVISIMPTADPRVFNFQVNLTGTSLVMIDLWADTFIMGYPNPYGHMWEGLMIEFDT